MDVGPAELLIVLVVFLVLFGGKKIPELARSLGQAKNEFEKGARGEPAEPEPAAQPESCAQPESAAQPGATATAAPATSTET